MDRGAELTSLLVLCLLAGILAQTLSGLFRLPSIIFLLGLGVALGPDGIGLIEPERLGPGLEVLVRLSVAFILFEGSMRLRLRDTRKVQLTVRRLITAGVFITFVLAAAAAHWIARLPMGYACLFGALVSVTGPTVIRPLVQRVKVRPEIAAILEGEGILADPIGALLATVCLEYLLSPGDTPLLQVQELGLRLGTGALVGAATGGLAGLMVKYRAPSVERLKPLVVLACAFGGYVISEQLRRESGIMAVVAAGLAIQHGIAAHDRELREFKELVTTVLLSVLFILLSANLRRERMEAEGLRGLLTVLTVMLVVRPLNIFLCTAGGKPTFREKLFLSWVAPRGIVAASVASLGALVLEREGHADAHRVESLIFLTILLTVLLSGSSAKLLAWALRITVKEARAILIVGGNPLGRAVARAYLSVGKQVTLIDRNPALIEQARAEGLTALCGDATDREVLRQAGLGETDIVIALTPSTAVNQTVAQLAVHDHDLEQVWIALDSSEREKLDPVLLRAGVQVAFGRAVPMDLLLRRIGKGEAGFLEVEVTAENASRRAGADAAGSPEAVPVFTRREGRVDLVRSSTRLQAGDRLTVLASLETLEEQPAPAAAARDR